MNDIRNVEKEAKIKEIQKQYSPQEEQPDMGGF